MAKNQRRAEAAWFEGYNRWQIKVQRDGKRKTFYSALTGRKGKRDAEGKADDWLEAGQPDDMRFDAAWAVYLDYAQRNTSKVNYTDIESIGRNWILDSDDKKRLLMKKLSKIKQSDLQELIIAAGEAGKSKRTCKNIKDKLSSFFRFAKDNDWHYIDASRLKLPTQAKVGKRKVVQPDKLHILFSEDTIQRYGSPVFCRDIYAWRFLVALGYRRGELCGFRQSDYNGISLTTERSVNRFCEVPQGKNENARRTNVVPQFAQSILADQANMLKAEGVISPWLFPAEDGSPMIPNNLYKRWTTFSRQHGINTSLHELRHTFVSITKAEMPETLLKDIIGHSASMDTDGVYGHEIDGEKQRAADILDDIFTRILS